MQYHRHLWILISALALSASLGAAQPTFAQGEPAPVTRDMLRRGDSLQDAISRSWKNAQQQLSETKDEKKRCEIIDRAITTIEWFMSEDGMRLGIDPKTAFVNFSGAVAPPVQEIELTPELKERVRVHGYWVLQDLKSRISCPPPTNNATAQKTGTEGTIFQIPGTDKCVRITKDGSDVERTDCAGGLRARLGVPDGMTSIDPPADKKGAAAPADGKEGANLLKGEQPTVRGGVDSFDSEWVGRQQAWLDGISRRIADAASLARKAAAAGDRREYLKARNAIEVAAGEVKESPGADHRIRGMIQDEANEQLAALDKQFGNKKWPSKASDTLEEAVPKSTKKASGGSSGKRTVKQQAPATGAQGNNEAASQLGQQILQGVIQSGIQSAIGRAMGGGGDRRQHQNSAPAMKKTGTQTVKPATTTAKPSGGSAPSGPILFQGYTYTPGR